MKANINGITMEVEDSPVSFSTEIKPGPTLEERLEAVESAMLEQLLRGL